MTKENRLTIKVNDADIAWLEEQEEELGIDKIGIICMMIRRARKTGAPPIDHVPAAAHHEGTWVMPVPPLPEPQYADETNYDEEPEAVDEEVIEDIVAQRLDEAKVTSAPEPVMNGAGYQTAVRPLQRNSKRSGKEWMKT